MLKAVEQKFPVKDDNPYCLSCYGKLFALKCAACTKPITGAEITGGCYGGKRQTVKFGKREIDDTSTCITISNLTNYIGIPGLYGGFTIEFQKQIDKEQLQLINIEELCQCNICLSIKNYQLIDSSIIDLDEFKRWSLITSSWSRMAQGSAETHKINSNEYLLLDQDFV
ncbi:unnamed protein product [Didymodactylos carnosus]|uniref:Uncharacterized protein n=1 Tax=Didymodactylos carnosus TaxID=1234261 RepID=A0A8S2DNP6_9BILA|nr:unnamed protein product [Didymodactylos carnosus]CAF3763728.1 unnamed protein product [Didymodactylos carnosus]